MPWYEHFISAGSGLFWATILFGIPYAAVYGLISLGGRFLEQGRLEGAAEDRRRALEHLEHAPDSAETDLTRGRLLAGLVSWDESLDSLTKSLKRTPERHREQRTEVMGWLALTCFAALRTDEALAWADRSLAGITDPAWRAGLEEAAVEALLDLRCFPEALERADASLAAMDASPASTTPAAHADRLRAVKMHAEHYLARLDAARATMEQIADPESRTRAFLLRSRIHALHDDWDAARSDLLAAREMLAAGVASRTWWFPAMAALYMADIAADTGRPDEARAEMAAGLEVLGMDEGARRWLDAFVAWVYARIGDHEAARRSIAAMMERWDRVEGLPAGTRDRIDLARTYEALGEADAARAAYAEAVATGLDFPSVRHAAARLRDMGPPEPQ